MSEMISDPIGLIEYVTRNLVKHPDEVRVVPVTGPTALIIELHLNPEDLGAVIGKNGRIARAIRTLLNSIQVKNVHLGANVPDGEDKNDEKVYSKVILEIIDQ